MRAQRRRTSTSRLGMTITAMLALVRKARSDSGRPRWFNNTQKRCLFPPQLSSTHVPAVLHVLAVTWLYAACVCWC
eukprot:2019284-Rhodomonas_salina.1